MIEILIILLLAALAAIKVSLQSRFGRTSIKNGSDAIFFNCVLFFFTDAINASKATVLFAAALVLVNM